MKKLLLLLFALAFSLPSFAALTVTKGGSNSGNPPSATTVSASVGTGQVILAFCQGGNLPGSATVSDNVDTGNYSVLYENSSQNMVVYWKITNVANAGSTAVTLATPGGYAYIWVTAITGFVGTPTSDTTIQALANGTSTTPTISATSNYSNEAMLVFSGTSYTQVLTATGWTSASTNTGYGPFYAIEATPTTNNFSGSWGTSQAWYLVLAGIYDPGGGACTHDFWSSGSTFAVPNGTTGSYWSTATGAFATPNCSSGTYWLSTGATGST